MKVVCFVSRRVLLAAALAIAAAGAYGQTTIINTPSTDTLQKGMFYLELDLSLKPGPYQNGGFQSYGYRTVYGVNRKTEIGVSFFDTHAGLTYSPKEAQFSLKRSLYINEKWGVASAAGVTAYIPLNTAGERGVFLVYANVSKTIEKARGLRLTTGVYHVFNARPDFGAKNGVTLAFEQPVIKRVTFVGDWYSGHNRFGYAAAGINFAITKKQSILGDFNFGNSGRGNNSLGLLYDITF